MEIRAAREAELEELVELQCLVFRPNGHERYWTYYRDDPDYCLEHSRVVLDRGRIVAHLRVWDRLIRVRGASLRAGGIGSLLTHPDHRRRGYARALLADTEQYLIGAGFDLGLLFSVIGTPFYEERGGMVYFRTAGGSMGVASDRIREIRRITSP